MRSSKTSKAILAIGGFVIVASALVAFGAAATWWQGYQVRTRWPAASATIQRCDVKSHNRRNSNLLVWAADCAITFQAKGETVKGGINSLGAYYEHRPKSWGNPGIDELRAWVAAHPPGTVLTVHYNPEWPPQTEPVPPDPIFDRYSNTLTLRIAGIAAAIGIGLLVIALAVGR